MPTVTDIRRVLRDHVRFTGDGQPNAPVSAPLPVGDPRSGLYNLDKYELRELLIAILQTQGDPDALQTIIADLDGKADAAGIKMFTLVNGGGTANAATAEVAASQASAPVNDGCLISLLWPATNTAVNPTLSFGGTTYAIRRRNGADILPGEMVGGRRAVLIRHSASTLRLVSASGTGDIIGLDDALALLTGAANVGDMIRLNINNGASTAQQIVGSLSSSQTALSLTTAGRLIQFLTVTANTGPGVTLNIDGTIMPVRRWDNSEMRAGELKGNRRYIGTVTNDGALRLIGTTEADIEAAAAALNSRIDGAMARGGKIFPTRQAAIDFGREQLTPDLGAVLVVEGEWITVRTATSTNDALFAVTPRWGMVRRVPTEGLLNLIQNALNGKANRSEIEALVSQLGGKASAADLAELQQQVGAVILGIRIVGDWNPATASFPSQRPDGAAIQAGDQWNVAGAGEVGGVEWAAGDVLTALKSGGGAAYAGNWSRRSGTATLADQVQSAFLGLSVQSALEWLDGSIRNNAGVTPQQYGVTGDGSPEDMARLKAMLDETSLTGIQVNFGDVGNIYRLDEWACPHIAPKIRWKFDGAKVLSTKAVPNGPNWEDDFALRIDSGTIGVAQLSETYKPGETYLTLPADLVAQIIPGACMIRLQSTRMISTDDRGQARCGFVCGVSRKVSDTVVELDFPNPSTMLVGNSFGQVTAVNRAARQFTVASMIGTPISEARYRIQFNTVGGVPTMTQFVNPAEFDPLTGTFTLTNFFDAWPAGLQVGDTLTVLRSIEAWVTYGCDVEIHGMTLERDFHGDASPGDLGFRGLVVNRALEAKISGLTTRNFSECGMQLLNPYNGDFWDQYHYNCNRAYAGSDGTGYGISVIQGSKNRFKDIIGSGCRRTLDFGGTQMMSWDNETDEIVAYGGGTSYTGERFWPNGPVLNGAVGSHGGGRGTIFKNSRGVDVYTIVNTRGAFEAVRGVYGAGKIERLVGVLRSDGFDIDGLFFSDGRPEWVPDLDFWSKFTQRGKLNDAVLYEAGRVQRAAPIAIRNARLSGIKRSLLAIQGAGEVGPVLLGGQIDIQTDNQEGDSDTFWTVRRVGSDVPTLTGVVDLRSVMVRNHPDRPKALLRHLNFDTFSLVREGHVRMPGGQVVVPIENDGVFILPVDQGFSSALVSIYPYVRDRPWQMISGRVEVGRTGNKAPLDQRWGVDILAQTLTGTTGPAGGLAVALRPDGTSGLYVQNRAGSRQIVQIDCNALM